MTQSHIKFEPLILPRKTPAEEAREHVKLLESKPTTKDALASANALAARLETPDTPKRWDGVWPWVGELGRDNANVHLSPELRWHLLSNCTCVYTGEATHGNDMPANQSPYHDGVIITITAGDGTEFPRMVKAGDQSLWLCCGKGEGKSVFLQGVGEGSLLKGDVVDWWCGARSGKPLPPGTKTIIRINHTLPTTEERYSVEVVEPEKPKFEPITIGDTIVSAGDNWVEADYGCSISAHRFPIARAREIAAAITAAANHLDPQEQPATVAVAEGLPLEFRCAFRPSDTLKVDMLAEVPEMGLRLTLQCRGEWSNFHLSPADEARLRNLLNQRAEGGGV